MTKSDGEGVSKTVCKGYGERRELANLVRDSDAIYGRPFKIPVSSKNQNCLPNLFFKIMILEAKTMKA